MKKTIFIAVLSVSVLVAMCIWLLRSGSTLDFKETMMIIVLIAVVDFAIFFAFRRLKSAKQKLPPEDELSRSIKQRGAATAYHMSLYMWLAMMLFEEHIDLDRSTLIGAGILGMVLIFGLSWIYHNYIRKSHD